MPPIKSHSAHHRRFSFETMTVPIWTESSTTVE